MMRSVLCLCLAAGASAFAPTLPMATARATKAVSSGDCHFPAASPPQRSQVSEKDLSPSDLFLGGAVGSRSALLDVGGAF